MTVAVPVDSDAGVTTRQEAQKDGDIPHGVPISAQGIRHAFVRDGRAVTALWDFSLEVPAGQFLSIVGPSGCGKTTFLQMMGGLATPGAGGIQIGGSPLRGPSPDTAYMLARDAMLPWRNALQNVEFGLAARGVPRKERHRRTREWMARVHLAGFEDARVTELSQGMRQRVAIARTLATEPRCLLMDEPFAALDAQTRSLVQREFLRLWESIRPTVILITHDLNEAIALGDRVVVMSHRPGRVLEDVWIDLPRPRTEAASRSKQFLEYQEHLSGVLRDEVNKALQGTAEEKT